MGWWLLGKKTRTQPRKKGRGASGAAGKAWQARWDPRRTLAMLNLLAVSVLVLGLLLGWRTAESSLREYVTRELADPVVPEQVELAEAPAWVPSWLADQLQGKVARHVSADPLDRRGLEQAADALAQSAWVEQVQRVQRLPDGRVVVHARYRQPMALVRTEHGYHLVTHDAIRLPGLYVDTQLPELGLPVITGVGSIPFEEGEVWPGQSIQAGLALVRYLAGEPYFKQIAAFDVSQRDRRGRLQLRLQVHQGGQVVWGLPPGEERALEPEPEEKRHRLRRIYQEKGAIDAGSSLVIINAPEVLRDWDQPGDRATRTGYTLSH